MSTKIKSGNTHETIQLIRQGMANKLSPRHSGTLSYEVGIEADGNTLYLRLTDSQPTGGLFSKEWVNLNRVADMLDTLADTETFRSSVLQNCMEGKSKNNGGFLCAALRAEGLLAPVPDKPFLHSKGHPVRDWLATQTKQTADPKAKSLPSKRRKKSPPQSLFNDVV